MMSAGISVPGIDDGVHYSFATEYNGPPVTYELPQAVPIDVERIPVASVLTQVPLSHNLDLPVVQPISASDLFGNTFSEEIKKVQGSDVRVSPKSVISFDRRLEADQKFSSKELVSRSIPTVSPTSVIVFEERETDGTDCIFSGESSSPGVLDSSNECCDSSLPPSGVINGVSLGLPSISIEHSDVFSGEAETSRSEYSDCIVQPGNLSNNSDTLGVSISNDCGESTDFNDLNPPEWASSGSPLSLEYPSSRISSLKAVECNNVSKCNVKRNPVITFRNIDINDESSGDYNHEVEKPSHTKNESGPKQRKGSCYRCLKGNRFSEKEVCIVCDAKYCVNCVLRAMGSMPEGRKCVSCIGFSINESKRGSLGKSSRILKRLLNGLEVQQIMMAEKSCEVNQLPAEYVYVNGVALAQEELISLQRCPCPPKKLKPGSYWYDEVSGLWGKEGQKPSQIISPHLNVGGPMETNASNGNTQVFINGREITKVELRMLQLAGVQCAGNPHFWVNEDGSYQEEGQKNTKGYIWGKAGTKLLCAFLSLPVPSKSPCSGSVQNPNPLNRTVHDYFEQTTPHKLLLVGYDGSGSSTIFKQAKILYKTEPFSKDERENIKLKIQTNVYGYLGMLLEGRERFEAESLTETKEKHSSSNAGLMGNDVVNTEKSVYAIGPRLKEFSDCLLKNMASGNLEAISFSATREYTSLIEELWNDEAIQATYNRKKEIEPLPTVASYFLERAVVILNPEYEPSDMDILHAECVTPSNGLACVDFTFSHSGAEDSVESTAQYEFSPRYQLISLHSRGLGENCKLLQMFEDVRIVIFCVALSDYDEVSYDPMDGSSPINKMLLARTLFQTIITHPSFHHMDFLLLLNKFDVFEQKMERSSLGRCEWFGDFNPIISRHRANTNSASINSSPSLGLLGFHYIAVKFKRLFASLVGGRRLYAAMVKGLEPDSVDRALRYAREIVKWDEDKMNFGLSECSFESSEPSF